MSASPSGGPNGQKPTPPESKGLPRPIRRPRPANPLVQRRKPHQRPAGAHAPGTSTPAAAAAPGGAGVSRPVAKPQPQKQAEPNFDEIRKQNGGWSQPAPAGYADYPLVLTKKSLKEGIRFHVMKLAPPNQRNQNRGVDPSDQTQFTRPVTLHRRDPRQPPPGREAKEEPPEQTPEQIAEAEKLAQAKAEREAQRVIDDAQKAPVMRDNTKKSLPKQKEKKTATQTHYGPRTEEQKKQSEIRYEEALPWHLEDADGKNVWVGQYEAPLSETKVALMLHGSGFRMVPMEKWYKFTSKRAALNSLSIEEAEKVMGAKAPVSRWAMRDAQRERRDKELAESRDRRVVVKQEAASFKSASRREKMDHDDIDMSGDEFQDDDETAGFEPDRDEDAKDSKERIRREQLKANFFNTTSEKDVDKEEDDEKKEEELTKLFGKGLKKALKKRDKQFQYDSDDSARERDPFADTDSETDSDEENKKDDEKDEKDKDASGVNSKGNNTPQGKKSAAEAAKKGKKRAASPLASDSSEAESSRKKKKKTAGVSSLAGSRSGTPIPGQQRRAGAGSGSDGEATGGEMSDGAGGKKKKKKQHLHLGTGARGTPSGSRAASPAPAQGRLSPTKDGGSTPRSPGGKITTQEVRDAIPESGISISALLNCFRGRVVTDPEVTPPPGSMTRKEFLALVKTNSVYSKQTKLLMPKPAGSA